MKKYSLMIALGAVLASTSIQAEPVTTEEAASRAADSNTRAEDKRWTPGEEQYSQFIAEYKSGAFQSQLTQLTEDVQKVGQERPELFKQTLEHARENKAKIEQMSEVNQKILTNAISALKSACSDNGKGEICQLVVSLDKNGPNAKKFNDAFMGLHALALVQDTSKYDEFTKKVVTVLNAGLNKLLYPIYSKKSVDQSNMDLPKAIEFEMIESLKKLNEQNPGNPLADKIRVVIENYPAHYANFVDLQTLSLLANGRISPKNKEEEAVQKIAQNMEKERLEELRKLFPMAMNQGSSQPPASQPSAK